MAVSLSKAGFFPWDKFRAELAKAIREQGQDGLDDYYHRWLDALEACLQPANLLDHETLHAREREYRDHVRDEVF
ncbi:nitrile hydratase accessory protein [uncultured Agrobacterium sp.]|uniref:nitrile hydratase accessory protein n=1 Tax=uncultured Agrobacterium sp. TaxID=157277 RepID=UPI0025DD6F13|nr:nitrile hydratase accessory protein [uncultured Agrobacterium sp.]